MTPSAPPAGPLYIRLAEQILQDARREKGTASAISRLPSERTLSSSLGVNRQSVRRALSHLRTHGLVFTDKSGTYLRAEGPPGPPAFDAEQLFPGGAIFPGLTVRASARLSVEPVPPPIEALLGLAPTRPSLVHRQHIRLPSGETLQRSISYFSPAAISSVPQLKTRLRRLPSDAEPDMRHLYLWMAQAGIHAVRRDCVRVSLVAECGNLWLSMRRLVHDQRHQILELTDLHIAPEHGELTYEFMLPPAAEAP
ncbi:GntR family transcriptional regulator [Streptomyces sp. NPDC048641]|uniref:GntR family transcriptional regulator n=1 Tax=Streptomyces sp. NPDC048641 TaxID=3154825 RepID=UPI003447947A